jgi:hypothetical protein
LSAVLIGMCSLLLLLPPADAVRDQNKPSLLISPTSVSFPQTRVGAQSAPQSITILNTTDAPIAVQEILVSGIDFAETNNCTKQLASGAKCSIQVTFKPAIPGGRIGSLEIIGSGSLSQFLSLNGTGIS